MKRRLSYNEFDYADYKFKHDLEHNTGEALIPLTFTQRLRKFLFNAKPEHKIVYERHTETETKTTNIVHLITNDQEKFTVTDGTTLYQTPAYFIGHNEMTFIDNKLPEFILTDQRVYIAKSRIKEFTVENKVEENKIEHPVYYLIRT